MSSAATTAANCGYTAALRRSVHASASVVSGASASPAAESRKYARSAPRYDAHAGDSASAPSDASAACSWLCTSRDTVLTTSRAASTLSSSHSVSLSTVSRKLAVSAGGPAAVDARMYERTARCCASRFRRFRGASRACSSAHGDSQKSSNSFRPDVFVRPYSSRAYRRSASIAPPCTYAVTLARSGSSSGDSRYSTPRACRPWNAR